MRIQNEPSTKQTINLEAEKKLPPRKGQAVQQKGEAGVMPGKIVTQPLAPVAPVASFEKAVAPTKTQTPQSVTQPSVPAVEAQAAVKEHLVPLAELVEAGPKPPLGLKPSMPGMLTDEQPLEHGVPFGTLLRDLGAQLRSENTQASVKDQICEMLLTTTLLSTAAESISQSVPTPPPAAVVEQVAVALRQSGDILVRKEDAPGGLQAHEGIDIPGFDVINLEEAIQGGGFDFSTMDVETMAMVIMFQAGRDAQSDLRDMMKEMEATRHKKNAMRKQMQALKEAQTRADSELRAEYNRRRRLPVDDSEHIPDSITFDQFKAEHELSFPRNEDGAITGEGVALGTGPLYPQAPAGGGTDDTGDTNEPDGTGGPGGTTISETDPEVRAIAEKYNLPEDVTQSALQAFSALEQSGMLAIMLKGADPTFENFLGALGHTNLLFASVTAGALKPGAPTQQNVDALVKGLERLGSTYLNEDWVMQQLVGAPPGSGGLYDDLVLATVFNGTETDSVAHAKINGVYEDRLKAYDELKSAARQLFGDSFGQALASHEQKVASDLRAVFNESMSPGEFSEIIGPLAQEAGLTEEEITDLCRLKDGERELEDAAFASLIVTAIEEGDDARDGNDPGTLAEVQQQLEQALDALKAWTPKPEDSNAKASIETMSPKKPLFDGTMGPKGPAPTAPPIEEPGSTQDPAEQPLPNGPGGSGEGVRETTGNFSTFDNLISAKQNEMDSLGELGEAQQLRLQMYMDRMTGLHSTISNMLKKWSDTSSGIVANLK